MLLFCFAFYTTSILVKVTKIIWWSIWIQMDFNRNFAYFLYHHSFHSNATKTFFFNFTNNQEPSHVNAHVAKLFPLFLTQLRSQDPIDPFKVTDHFTCISTNVIYCITCTPCKKVYIGETGRRLAGRFRKHLRDVEKNNTDVSKQVARHFTLPNHSYHNMTIWAKTKIHF